MADFHLGAGDTGPAITATLTDAAGAPVPLAGAAVRFRMRAVVGGTTVVDRAAEILDAPTGRVRYQWQAGDTDAAGEYLAGFAVTFGSGVVESVPNDRHLRVLITGRLA